MFRGSRPVLPTDGDEVIFFRAEQSFSVQSIDCLASADSIALDVVGCDANGVKCGSPPIGSGTCEAVNVALPTEKATLEAGSWVRIQVAKVAGTPSHVVICMVLEP